METNYIFRDLPWFYNRNSGLIGLYRRLPVTAGVVEQSSGGSPAASILAASSSSVAVVYLSLSLTAGQLGTGLLPITGDFEGVGYDQVGLYSCKYRTN